MKYTYLFLLVLLGSTWACKTKPSNASASTAKQGVQLLDSIAAGEVIVVDQEDGFFEEVGILDMSIQMGRNYEADVSRAKVLEEYQQFLKQDLRNFTAEEQTLLRKVFAKAKVSCDQLNPDIFPKKLQLLKSAGAPYGAMTFYTREHCIVIPEGLLGPDSEQSLYEVALHEIFHIYSRYNAEKRKALYALIGFEAVPKEYLALPEILQKRLLLNPDGINYAYRIKLKKPDGKTIQAIPLIVATKDRFDPAQPAFFGYLKFDLYQIQAPYTSRIPVMAQADGKSTINFQQIPNFFEQIQENTGYIIHPDEILADNFMFVASGQGAEMKDLKEGGKKLLKDVEEILRQP